MKIDVHTHIFPPEVVSNREAFFDNEPAFRLLYGSPKAKIVTAEGLITMMDELGIDVAVTFGFPWESMEMTKRHNDYILESAAKYDGRLIPLACVFPLTKEAEFEVARCLESGAMGAGELAIYGEASTDEAIAAYGRIADVVRRHGKVMLIHANEPIGHSYPGKAPYGLAFYYEILKRCADVPVILAHWGGGIFFFGSLKKEVDNVFKNTYFDTAASPFLYKPCVYKLACQIVGADRILLGTDYPLLKPDKYFSEMNAAGLTPEEKEKISGLNAVELFNIRKNRL